MAITSRANRCEPTNRRESLINAAFVVLQRGALFCASTIALEARVSPSLVKHYLYPMADLRKHLVREAVATGDPKKLAPLLTWPEAQDVPQALRLAAALELAQ